MRQIKIVMLQCFLVFMVMDSYAQNLIPEEVERPQKVISDFKSELEQSGSNSDTIPVYVKTIKRLIARGNYLQADSILTNSITDFEALGDSVLMAEIYKERAFMYKVQRRYPKSLADYLWLKTYYESKDSKNDLVEIYSLLAEYYRSYRNFELMGKHLLLAETLIDQYPVSKENIAYWCSRKAAWSTEYTGNSDSIEYYAKKGLEMASGTNAIYTRALLLNELGFLAMNQEKEDLLQDYFERSKNLLFENQRYRDYVDVANNLASWTNDSQPEESLKSLEFILSIEEENGWHTAKIRTLEVAISLYRHFGQLDKADESHHKLFEARIQETTTANAIAVNDLAITYEKNLTEKELEVQEQKTETAELEARKNQRAFVISFIIAVILLLIVIISVQINRKFRKKNALLRQQQLQIQKNSAELEKSLDQQRILFKELNHRVKNNLSILTGLIYLQEVGEDDRDFRKTLETLRNRIKSMALAHESLYNSEEAEKIEFQGYLRELFLELRSALSETNRIKTQIECQGFELGLQQAVPLAMIINELFTNSVKHGFTQQSEGVIKVKAWHETQRSIIEYSDNGIGFSLEQKEQRTLGLRLVKLLLEQLDAQIEDKSGTRGVHFILKIPLVDTKDNYEDKST